MTHNRQSLFHKIESGLSFDGQTPDSNAHAVWLGSLTNSIKLRPLVLADRTKLQWFSTRYLGRYSLIAAALALALFGSIGTRVFDSHESDHLAKGKPRVKLYYQHDGVTEELKVGKFVKSGDKVMAEILSPASMVAYWTVVDREKKSLLSHREFLASELRVSPNLPQTFARSLEIFGNSTNGEHLVVFLCKDPLSQLPDVSGKISSCLKYEHELR